MNAILVIMILGQTVMTEDKALEKTLTAAEASPIAAWANSMFGVQPTDIATMQCYRSDEVRCWVETEETLTPTEFVAIDAGSYPHTEIKGYADDGSTVTMIIRHRTVVADGDDLTSLAALVRSTFGVQSSNVHSVRFWREEIKTEQGEFERYEFKAKATLWTNRTPAELVQCLKDGTCKQRLR